MKITIESIRRNVSSTLSTLNIDGEFYCFVLEGNDTLISPGVYVMAVRRGSPMSNRYDNKYHKMDHDGMLWLLNVYNFNWVYIHIGNYIRDTEGCLLVGLDAYIRKNNDRIGGSTMAYKQIYPLIHAAIMDGDDVTIEVIR